jgi:hypothetical protein
LIVLEPGANPPDPRGSASPVTPVASLRDGDQTILLSADGTVWLAGADDDLRAALGAALRGALPPVPDLASLRPGHSALMGRPSTAPAFGPEAPVGTRVATGQPTFRWTPHPDAAAYDVKVFDQDFREQASGVDVSGTQWQPPRPLAPGRIYLWQVSAHTSHGRVTAPAPPRPEARFEVAGDALLAQVTQRRSGAPSSHLVAALAFVEAGLLDDAEAELAALDTANPGNPQVPALRERLRGMR